MPWTGQFSSEMRQRPDAWKALTRYAASVRQNGMRGTLQNVAALIDDAYFDWRHGTETAGIVELQALDVHGGNKHLGIEYTPTRIRAFRKLMDRLAPPDGHVFVDFGCGKGRVLLAAMEYPFRRVVGVEFAPELCAVCRRNVDTFRTTNRSRATVSVVEADAVDYAFAGDEDVLFFFNPFRAAVMEQVLANIRASIASHPRAVQVIVSNPDELVPVLQSAPVLSRISDYAYGSSRFLLYANRPM